MPIDVETQAPIALTEHNIKVLLVDDQRIVGETVRRMLAMFPAWSSGSAEIPPAHCRKPITFARLLSFRTS